MTQDELKAKIEKTKKAIANEPEGSEDRKMMEAFLKKLEAQLEPEKQPEPKQEPKAKPEKKKVVVKKKADTSTSLSDRKDKTENKKQETSSKDLEIEKGQKKESHKLDTAFDKDIKDAVLTLNKHRFVVREIKNKTTKKVVQVHHSPEYKNAKTIQKRVEAIFDSSVYDIAKTKKEKAEKKPIIEVVTKIKDLHTLWLNEVDLIINNENQKELETIANLMEGLIKQAKKNDGQDKWQTAGGLAEIAKKYNL